MHLAWEQSADATWLIRILPDACDISLVVRYQILQFLSSAYRSFGRNWQYSVGHGYDRGLDEGRDFCAPGVEGHAAEARPPGGISSRSERKLLRSPSITGQSVGDAIVEIDVMRVKFGSFSRTELQELQKRAPAGELQVGLELPCARQGCPMRG